MPQRMLDQRAQLDRLHWLLADTRRLVAAVTAVEGNAAAKSTLQVRSSPMSYTCFWFELMTF